MPGAPGFAVVAPASAAPTAGAVVPAASAATAAREASLRAAAGKGTGPPRAVTRGPESRPGRGAAKQSGKTACQPGGGGPTLVIT